MLPSDIMQIIKSISAREFFRVFPEIRAKYFLGGKFLTQSYFIETIGNANEEMILQHVRNQLKEMDRVETKYKQLKLFYSVACNRVFYKPSPKLFYCKTHL
jgi:putative transposase